ncbi:MAG: hypothetical protein GXO47_06395 [Chlorobi bacterium]|nr:hypothetical protein [Chlorobiota bacterium]
MTNNPFEIKFSKKKDSQTINFTGNLIINHIDDIFNTVKDKVDKSKDLHIKISEPENIDLTFIQMVLSLQKTWLNNNRDFSVETKIKEELKLILNNSGFSSFLK